MQIEEERAIVAPVAPVNETHEAIGRNAQPLQPLQQQELVEVCDDGDGGDAIDGNFIQSVVAEFTDSESSENETNPLQPLQQEELVEAGMVGMVGMVDAVGGVGAVGDAVDGNSKVTQHPQPIQRKRRFSMAGGTFFSVNENTVEMGSDYLNKKPIETNIIATLGIQNNFDPFQRIANLPFALRGRTRSASQDGFKYLPALESIPE